jgi:1,4-dihydroxy-2-naphthoate octaprenyltransferase
LYTSDGLVRWRFVAALIVALALQIGTNYANDYSDGKRGTDDPGQRTGPPRLVGWGLAPASQVKAAAMISFAVAAIAGLALAAAVSWWLLVVGVLSIAAGWFYTGGPRPYGYAGLGEVFVFLFFGLVAVNGSYYVQLEQLDLAPFLLSIPIGLLSAAILVVNNVRDIDTDRRAGKRTLAVRLGRQQTRTLFSAMLLVADFALIPVAFALSAWVLLPVLTVPLAARLARTVRAHVDGPTLNAALARTGMLQLMFCVLLSVGILAS